MIILARCSNSPFPPALLRSLYLYSESTFLIVPFFSSFSFQCICWTNFSMNFHRRIITHIRLFHIALALALTLHFPLTHLRTMKEGEGAKKAFMLTNLRHKAKPSMWKCVWIALSSDQNKTFGCISSWNLCCCCFFFYPHASRLSCACDAIEWIGCWKNVSMCSLCYIYMQMLCKWLSCVEIESDIFRISFFTIVIRERERIKTKVKRNSLHATSFYFGIYSKRARESALTTFRDTSDV